MSIYLCSDGNFIRRPVVWLYARVSESDDELVSISGVTKTQHQFSLIHLASLLQSLHC